MPKINRRATAERSRELKVDARDLEMKQGTRQVTTGKPALSRIGAQKEVARKRIIEKKPIAKDKHKGVFSKAKNKK